MYTWHLFILPTRPNTKPNQSAIKDTLFLTLCHMHHYPIKLWTTIVRRKSLNLTNLWTKTLVQFDLILMKCFTIHTKLLTIYNLIKFCKLVSSIYNCSSKKGRSEPPGLFYHLKASKYKYYIVSNPLNGRGKFFWNILKQYWE